VGQTAGRGCRRAPPLQRGRQRRLCRWGEAGHRHDAGEAIPGATAGTAAAAAAAAGGSSWALPADGLLGRDGRSNRRPRGAAPGRTDEGAPVVPAAAAAADHSRSDVQGEGSVGRSSVETDADVVLLVGTEPLQQRSAEANEMVRNMGGSLRNLARWDRLWRGGAGLSGEGGAGFSSKRQVCSARDAVKQKVTTNYRVARYSRSQARRSHPHVVKQLAAFGGDDAFHVYERAEKSKQARSAPAW